MTKSKKHPQQPAEEPDSSCFREPAAAYGADINELKVELMQQIIEMENPQWLKKLLSFSKTLHKETEEETPAPCRFTVEEMNTLLDRAEADIKAGNTISANEMDERVLNKYLQ